MSRPSLARGLAASAVAALAVAGLTAPAHADAPLTVSLISQFTGQASTAQDMVGSGTQNYPITLTAKVSGSATVAFRYRAAGVDDSTPWNSLSSAVTADAAGYATFDWVTWYAGPYDIQVTATDGTNTVEDHRLVNVGSSVAGVALGTDAVPYFTQPYASQGKTSSYATVGGTTSEAGGTVALSWLAADGSFHGQTNAAVTPLTLKSTNGSIVNGGAFSGSIDITAFDATPNAIIAVAAERGSDDVRPLTLASAPQTISSIAVSLSSPTTSMSVAGVATVTDADGTPITGVQVRRASDNAVVGYTDAAGAVPVSQTAGSTEGYYANANDDAAYHATDGDRTTSATAPAYVQVATSVAPQLADGDVFDTDEYAPGDLALQVLDQYGHPVGAGDTVPYAVFADGAEAGPPTIGTTDADGRIVVAFDPAAAGSYTLAYDEPGGTVASDATTTFTVGDSTLSLSSAAGSAASGGTITYTGRLAVGNQPLPGRSIDLAYAPDGTSDAGIGAGHALTAKATTGEDGTFTVTVQDPSAAAAGSAAETGTLTATTGDNVASGDSTLTGNADETTSASARFVATPWAPPTDPQPPVTGGDPQPPVTGDDPQPPVTGDDPQPPAPPVTQGPIHLTGSGHEGRTDRLRIVVSPDFAGREVVLRRLVHGHWRKAAVGRVDKHGVLVLTVRDRNRGRSTTYQVTILAGSHPTSNTVTVS